MLRLALLCALFTCACAKRVPVSTRITGDYSVVQSGSELSIPCEVDGYPEPMVYWTKDGNRLTANDRLQLTNMRLTLSKSAPEDSGEYGCHATNEYTSHSSTTRVSVQGLYIPPNCTDNKFFANCQLIVKSKYCRHKYYSSFCCKSCVEAGQLNPMEIQILS